MYSLVLPFFGIGMKTDLFQSCGHCWVFQICWHIECTTLTALSFRTLNSSAGIPSPPLALFIVMIPKSHLTLHSRCLALHLALGCLLLLPSSFPASGTFQWVSFLYQLTKILEFQLQHLSFQQVQGWFPLGFSGLLFLPSKGFSGVFSSTAVQRHQFVGAPPSLRSFSHNHT